MNSEEFDRIPEAVEELEARERARRARLKRFGWAILILAALLSLFDVDEYRYESYQVRPGITATQWEHITLQRRRYAALDFIVWEALVVGLALGAWFVLLRPAARTGV